jgi:MerR family transcriptional regulator, light-induced transcriptional regulator
MSPALNIAALAKRTGVQPDTLRKWEHRYGVICPERTPGGQRRYSERDVARVQWLKARLSEGYRISEAAELLGSDEIGPTPQTPAEPREAPYAAVLAGEPHALELLVQHTLVVHDLDTALAGVVAPVLERVGEGWATGELTVAQEHMLSGVVRAHLERRLADARGTIRGVAVLACAPGERHELGLLMLAILLRADGWQVAYLGADTPTPDAARLACDLDARLLCVSATMPKSLDELAAELRLVSLGSDTRLVVGGSAVTEAAARSLGADATNGNLRKTVEALRD